MEFIFILFYFYLVTGNFISFWLHKSIYLAIMKKASHTKLCWKSLGKTFLSTRKFDSQKTKILKEKKKEENYNKTLPQFDPKLY